MILAHSFSVSFAILTPLFPPVREPLESILCSFFLPLRKYWKYNPSMRNIDMPCRLYLSISVSIGIRGGGGVRGWDCGQGKANPPVAPVTCGCHATESHTHSAFNAVYSLAQWFIDVAKTYAHLAVATKAPKTFKLLQGKCGKCIGKTERKREPSIQW